MSPENENENEKSTQLEEGTSSEQEKQKEIRLEAGDVKMIKCPKCGGNLFSLVYKIASISKSLPTNRTGQDITKALPFFKCERGKCGHILKDVRPG